VARILADACAGLHAAHELCADDGTPLHVVHRDFSPHNILVSAEGNVKVADFGVAKALGQLHEHTSAGQIKGKLAYMAPEQVAGTADRRSDIFSAGCVLYEATCGVAPFRADNDMQIMHNLMAGRYVRPSQAVAGYPSGLDRIVATALAPDPRQRFQTAEQLRVALEEWLARSGPVVTQAAVAQALRARIGDRIDRRKERIRSAQSASVPDLREDVAGMTPSGRGGPPRSSASGVKPVLVRGDRGDTPQLGHYSSSSPPPSSQVGHYSHPSQVGQSPMDASMSQVFHPGMTGTFQAPVQDDSGRYNIVGGIAIGVIFALLLGGGGYVFLLKGKPDAQSAPSASVARVPVPSASVAQLVPALVASVPVTAEPAVSAAIELPETPSLALEPNPPSAVVSVDGQAATAIASIPKPAPGKMVTLTFKSEGHEDATVKVDENTVAPIKVTLKWKTRASTTGPAIPSSPY
jgi:eukaryotic-like serine/threonine-protein kinase